MILFKKAIDLSDYLHLHQPDFPDTGFVPTMGALHSGHISLVSRSKTENQRTVVSIFVNPTQFNDPKDFQKYPVTLEKDIEVLEKAGTDILFLPSVEEIYPGGTDHQDRYDIGYLESILEGKYRPGHFQGVCQVMQRLIEIVKADNLYMGQKDYQQCLVIRRLLKLKKLPGILRICPTFRETDGLAMSSRNLRLNKEERVRAAFIYKALTYLRDNLAPGPISELESNAKAYLDEQGFKTDYVEIADADSLELIESWDGNSSLTGLIAAFNNEVRLIDNMIITSN